jgi:predicted  nucleic acid-binding Zn-ribbon protein
MRRHLLVVLGMHRSGTSALAALVARAGAILHKDFVPGRADGDGHAEPFPAVRFNDRLLARLGARWDNIVSLPPGWPAMPVVASLRKEATEIVAAQFGSSEFAVLNDPRLCRLLPFWHDVFAETDFVTSFALMVRRPAEVAASLARRDQFAPEKSLALWLSHLCDAERDTRGHPRALVVYDDLLEDAGRGFARVCDEASFPLRPTKERLEAATALVRPELKRQRRNEAAAASRAQLASGLDAALDDAYVRLLGAAGRDPFAVIAGLQATARTALGAALPPWLAAELAETQALARHFAAEIDTTRRQIVDLAAQVEGARAGHLERDKAEAAVREHVARAERDLADERATIAVLTLEVDRARQIALEYQQQTAAAVVNFEQLAGELDAVRSSALEQQQQLDAARETIETFLAEIASLRSDAQTRARRIEELSATLEQHAKREAEFRADVMNLRTEAGALRSERDALVPALGESQKAQEALTADRDRLARLEREARERSALLDGQIAALTADIHSLRARHEAYSAELARLSDSWYGRIARRLAKTR